MTKPLLVDLFAEDRGHESWVKPVIHRMGVEERVALRIRVRSARGGHGRVLSELKTYLKTLKVVQPERHPDLIVVAIDTNCSPLADARKPIQEAVDGVPYPVVLATPDPHIERWFFADLQAFQHIVGVTPVVPAGKCARDFYKVLLQRAVRDGGFRITLGGLEIAEDLVQALDWKRATRADSSFQRFVTDLRHVIRNRPPSLPLRPARC